MMNTWIRWNVLLCTFSIVVGKVNHVQLAQCASGSQAFDPSGLVCYPCDSSKVSVAISNTEEGDQTTTTTASTCVCSSSDIEKEGSCTLNDKRIGICSGSICSSECDGSTPAASLDQTTCIRCGANSTENVPTSRLSVFSATLDDCTCNNPSAKVPSDEQENYEYVMTKRLMDVYDDVTAQPIRKDCVQCPLRTAVITSDLLHDGAGTHFTAGLHYKPDPYNCVSCPDINMYFDVNYECKCSPGFTMVGEVSVGQQNCIKYTPSLSTDYSRVSFEIFNDNSYTTISIDSIIFSHHYLKAASNCEYANDRSPNTLRACQTLANLCVLSHYDKLSTPCQEFQSIIADTRIATYHGQEEWKLLMPWLYYYDNTNNIIQDDGIKMKMALRERNGYEHIMQFKLAKYDLDGNFLGMESLASHFFYCQRNDHAAIDQNNHEMDWMKFGNTMEFENQCTLSSLISRKMAFYDMFLVDTATSNCQSFSETNVDCQTSLYPIPVLIKNLADGEDRPNRANGDDDMNGVYTRRFFLYDNMSGKSAAGLKVLRYASKITLQTVIQNENPSLIYPPRLIIEYTEMEIGESLASGKELSISVAFKSEYTMVTKKFWTAIKIIIGFASAIVFLIWILRMNNWTSRNHKTFEDTETSGSLIMLHALMLLLHTFVLVFLPFVFLFCAFWYLLYTFQDTVFVLMPENNDSFMTDSLVVSMFLAQTLYIVYLIIKQCKSYIFFIDWEKPKDGFGKVSMWRKVMIVNLWCSKVQSSRKSSIEFNLMFLLFLLTSQHLNQRESKESAISKDVSNNMLQIANNLFLWLFVYGMQWILRVLFYERYIAEPKATWFIDLCTLTKISIFVMDEPYHGYYLHCRSPYEFADCNVEEMWSHMKKEGDGMTAGRGLNPASDCQTFEVFVSHIFRKQFKRPYMTLQKALLNSKDGNGDNYSNEPLETTLSRKKDHHFAKSELEQFLMSFIDQRPTPDHEEGLKYIIRDISSFITCYDKIFGTQQHASISAQEHDATSSKCVMLEDQQSYWQDFSFLSVSFLGIELDLFFHDMLCFLTIDIIFGKSAISILLTYLIHCLRTFFRTHFGTQNVANKIFMDKRLICTL